MLKRNIQLITYRIYFTTDYEYFTSIIFNINDKMNQTKRGTRDSNKSKY